MLDVSINKAPNWFTAKGLQLPSAVQTILDANSSIRQTEQKSQEKISDEEFSTGMLERLRYNTADHARRLLRSNKIPVNDENVKYYSDKLKEVTVLYNKGKNSREDYETGLILKSMICPF